MGILFDRACLLGMALGWENIGLQPGCQEHQIDENWWFAINPHDQSIACSHGVFVPAYHAYFEWKGVTAGFVSIGGGMLACGREANEGSLLAAIDRALERSEGDPIGKATIA